MGVAVVLAVTAVVLWNPGTQDPDPGTDEVDLPGPAELPVAPAVPEPGRGTAVARADPRWEVELAAPASEVTIAGSTVVAVVDTTLTGLDLVTGEIVWELELPGERALALAAVDDLVVAPLGAGGVLAVEAATGERVWHTAQPARALVRADGGLVVSDGAHVRGVDPQDGATRWRRHGPATVASGRAGPTVLVAVGDRLLGLDAGSGDTRWGLEAGTEVGRPDQSPRAGVAVAGGRLLLVGVRDGELRGTLLADAALGERIRGRPRVVGDAGAVVSVGDGLVGLDGRLEALWRTRWETRASLLAHHEEALAVLGGVSLRGVDPVTGVDVLRVTPAGWFTAVEVQDQVMALAVHTPTRGRLMVADLVDASGGSHGGRTRRDGADAVP